MRVLSLTLLSALLLCGAEPFWPGATYDPSVPTLAKIAGHEPGERITKHADIIRYMEALASAAPNRVKVFDYGKTWQGRRLIYVAVGSEANIRRLGELQSAMKKLADPRVTPEAEAKKLMASLPAVVWLGYGVHGNEISSPDAAMLTAHHLVAARNDKMVADILANTIVLIDPAQNPDGRDRFVQSFEQHLGLEPDPSPLAAEHVEPWPSGRVNHYGFDMNRDWFAMTQPETRGRIKTLLEWYPLVFVDLHEMGADSTYYFAPEAVPYNPHLTKDQTGALEWFGKNNAKWFDQYGFSYFTREVFDAFYPGYGASWPSYHGSVAMTYEQASARGLVMRRTDNTLLQFRDTIRQHFVASIATCETAARNKEKLLANFYAYRKTAIEEGQKEAVKEFVLARRGDTGSVDKLAVLLADQGVEVKRAAAPFQSGGKEVPAGSYVISLAQPTKRLIRNLLDADVPMSESFLKEAERRRSRKLSTEIYDVTAWSLPLLYNVEVIANAEPSTVAGEMVKPGSSAPGKVTGKATVAYLVPWGSTAAGRFLAAALRENLRVDSTDKPFVQGGRTFPGGTLIVPVKQNGKHVDAVVAKLAQSSGADVVGTDTGWVEEGVNFGSRYVMSMRPPSILLAWDRPTSQLSAGATRFVLERQFGYPVTVIRSNLLAMADLSRFHVIILPESSGEGYAQTLGAGGAQRLKQWVSAGGTLIGYSTAMSWMADPRVGLLAVQQENLANPDEKPGTPGSKPAGTPAVGASTTPASATPAAAAAPPDPRVPGKIFEKEEDYQKAIRPTAELPDSAPGALLRAKTDPDHWLTAGVAETLYAVIEGRSIFSPIKLDKGVNAAVFPGPKELLASGYLWEENRKQLAWKPLVVAQREGRGVIIGFAADPNFRAYQDGMNVLFLNAVFRGPAHSRPQASAEQE
jgi:hypothetical protein